MIWRLWPRWLTASSSCFRAQEGREGTVEEIFETRSTAYTKKLLAAVPKLGEMRGKAYPEPMRLPRHRRQGNRAHQRDRGNAA